MDLDTIRRRFPIIKRVRSERPNAMFVMGVIRDEDSWACFGLDRQPDGRFQATEPGYWRRSDADVREILDALMSEAEEKMTAEARARSDP